ncbi:hypothetical protein SFUMM280S_04922 [Streptomyces fumanus]
MWSASVVHTKRAVDVSEIRTESVSTPCRSSQARYSSKSAPAAPTRMGRVPSWPMPKAMFAATPPRRTSSLSTRNDSETVCSWSATSWSAKRPGKVMRWSVAMEPVTAMRTAWDFSWGRRVDSFTLPGGPAPARRQPKTTR